MKEPFLSDENAPKPSKLSFFKHLLVSLLMIGAVIAVCTEVYNLIPHGPDNALEGAKACMDSKAEEREYGKLVNSDFYNLENHRGYLNAHLSTPKVKHTKYATITRDDTAIIGQYSGYTRSPFLRTRDIGFYGLGYFYALTKDSDKALGYFAQVNDQAMPYLNNSIGKIYLAQKSRPDLAQNYFYKEITLKGNLKGAVSNLCQMFWKAEKYKEVEKLIQDPVLGPLVALQYQRYLDLMQGKFFSYLDIVAKTESDAVSFTSLLASLVIALMFLTYIYFVDVFEKEQIVLLVYLFSLGMLSAMLATVFYDLTGCFLNFYSTGDDFHDFWFYLFGVGLIEETSNALPVLIACFIWKKWDEPVDIFIFAAVSALGFACLENAGYFTRDAISLIVGRTLYAVVLHVCLTCLAVYGFFYGRYKHSLPPLKDSTPRRSDTQDTHSLDSDPSLNTSSGGNWLKLFYFLFYFFAAVTAHGLYDFFAASSMGLGIVSVLILILMMIAFRNMLENGLNLAEFKASGPLNLNLSLYLIYGLLGILLMQFTILDIQYGPSLSMGNLGHNLIQYYFLFLVLVSDFGNLKIVKGKWHSLLDRNK